MPIGFYPETDSQGTRYMHSDKDYNRTQAKMFFDFRTTLTLDYAIVHTSLHIIAIKSLCHLRPTKTKVGGGGDPVNPFGSTSVY